MSYELFCSSVRGASHIRKEIPCEDFGLKSDRGEWKIFAVADGHGDPNCLRSNIGSEYACKTALNILDEFARQLKEAGQEEALFDKVERVEILNQLKRSIVATWLTSVDNELKENPLTEDELQKATYYGDDFRQGIRTERMYGTTLITGLLTDKYLLLLHQGDGRCEVFDCKGNVSQPIPWDDRCVGTATTSMCDVDAVPSMRYHVINLEENPVIACVAGTDGVEDSFPTSMAKTHAYYREMLKEACEIGVEALEAVLPEDLNSLSKSGSADDITISGFIDVERTKPFLHGFEEDNRLVDIQDELAIVNDQIQSMENGGMFAHLSQVYDEAQDVYQRAEKNYHLLNTNYQSLAEKIAAHEQNEVSEEDNLPEWLKDRIKSLLLEPMQLATLQRELQVVGRKRETAFQELAKAEELKKTAEEQFLPRQEKYKKLIEQREAISEKLKKLEVE